MRTLRDIRFEGMAVARSNPADLLQEIASGLGARPQATLPAKLLYDDAGCELFDRICETHEYYPTRTELALLERVAADIAHRTHACELVELGSGHARKTHVLLDAMGSGSCHLRYIPFDVSAAVINASATRLMARYPLLSIFGVAGDFTRDLNLIPQGRRRLIAFLGGTIGNFDEDESRTFLRQISALMGPDDFFLLAADLVKDRAQLHAAYNDGAGITAAFNLNMIKRLQAEFGVELNPAAFSHDAFFNEEKSRIEMHARVREETLVRAPALELQRHLAPGESIRTEISRKFTRDSLATMLTGADLHVEAFYVADPPYSLTLCRRVDNRTSRL